MILTFITVNLLYESLFILPNVSSEYVYLFAGRYKSEQCLEFWFKLDHNCVTLCWKALKMNESESMYGTTISQESIKVIAEGIGVGNFPDEAAKDIAEDVSYRLKEIIQVSCVNFIYLYKYIYFL